VLSVIIYYMTTLYALITIVQSMSVSLGVGSSTIAILNFFTAIKDGQIDTSERRLMGVVYVVLRIAMVLILITTLAQAYILITNFGEEYFSGISLGAWTAIAMLYINAVLMTKHIMPATFGPAIQAGSWYTLGLLLALVSVQWNEFSYLQFILGYIALLTLAVSLVNGVMAYWKHKNQLQK
jgi:hypothetical protein